MSKLVNCKACNKEIAKGVKKCPNCGKDQRNFFMQHKVLTVIGVIVILGVLGSAGGKKNSTTATAPATETASKTETATKTEVKEEAIKVSAVNLAKAYEENEVSADKSYKDKTVEVSGKIEDIGVVAGQTYVVLSAEKDFAITNVQCFFKEQAEIDKVANLKKGDSVTIQGKVDGKSMNVGVNGCTLK